jgi:hypothetical protein
MNILPKKGDRYKEIGKKLGNKTEMKWPWIKDRNKIVFASDFYDNTE